MDDGVHGGPVRRVEHRRNHGRAEIIAPRDGYRPLPTGSEERLVTRGPEPLDPRPGPAEEALPPAREQLPLPRRRRQAHLEPQLREPGGSGDGTPFSAFSAPAAPNGPVTHDSGANGPGANGPGASGASPNSPAPRSPTSPGPTSNGAPDGAPKPPAPGARGAANPPGQPVAGRGDTGPPGSGPTDQPPGSTPAPQPRPARAADRAAAFTAATRRGRRPAQRSRTVRG
jgi:hypothetical protein